MITFEGISHLAMEVTDMDEAVGFYTHALGMDLIHKDEGELGAGRAVMQNGTGQLLMLEKVAALSPRSRFCSADETNVPDPGAGIRYKGAHLAMSVGSIEEYDAVYKRLEEAKIYMEGDVMAHVRGPNEKSVYFYDPSGNRLQLIILGAAAQR